MTATEDGVRQSRSPRGVAGRLLALLGLLIAVCAGTAGIVAYLIAPTVFHSHLEHAHLEPGSEQAAHVEHAFALAMVIAIAVGVGVSVVLAAGVSWVISRRVQRSVSQVATSTARIGAGDYRVRVAPSGVAEEFDELTATVNALAERLQHVDDTRRRMLSDLAHEIRTPLATITATLEAIEDGIREPDERTLGVVRGAAVRLQRLADDIAEVSDVTEGVPSLRLERMRADELVDAAVGEARARFADDGVDLVVGPTVAAPIDVDPQRISQVLQNLLNNAARHTPRGGRVTVAARLAGPDHVAVTVADTGDGIAAEHLPHVFDRFYRTDASRTREAGGTGIGLTIARAIVEAHDGTLTATSDGPGRGARFRVLLRTVE
ncbi:putative two-component histidine kinase [Gordonia araii NBRC 100433]|uniref:histidine kinase n=1 Tax=Gordonia araii NBRC 100433 TaxID=1073574 RepID=G7H6F9_9ACTN|nr:ATP-binding protein [Gordonia araii]NNG96114.1 HAMP domain-containing protein [Gordonia araii NBRC 100433]GAB11434.1 putative two-component histidine kinase [Gordonia araii NBRC 100433]